MLSKRYFLEGKDKQEVETYVGSAKVKQMRHSGQKDLSEPVMIFTKKSKQDWERSLHADTCGSHWGMSVCILANLANLGHSLSLPAKFYLV